ncbi:MAG: hypothetical protein AB7K68_02970 [Bacteriovoracia bacterium]
MKIFGWIGALVLVGILLLFFLPRGAPQEMPAPVIIENSLKEPGTLEPAEKSIPAPIAASQKSGRDTFVPVPNVTPPALTAGPAQIAPKAPPLQDVVLRDSQGNYPFLGKDEAIKACAKRGMQLPTIRELALLGQTRGAKGIVEPHELVGRDADAYEQVKALVPGGGVDEFYYDSSGYREPLHFQIGKFNLVGMHSEESKITVVDSGVDPEGFLFYWSSSEAVGHHLEEDPNLHSFYVFDVHGKIHDHYRSVKGLIRCVQKQ